MTEKKEIAIAKEAFEMQSWIEACDSGGAEPPPIITSIESVNDVVNVHYTLPDCYIDAGKPFVSSYLFNNNKLFTKDKESNWTEKCFSGFEKYDVVIKEVTEFCIKHNLSQGFDDIYEWYGR